MFPIITFFIIIINVYSSLSLMLIHVHFTYEFKNQYIYSSYLLLVQYNKLYFYVFEQNFVLHDAPIDIYIYIFFKGNFNNKHSII